MQRSCYNILPIYHIKKSLIFVKNSENIILWMNITNETLKNINFYTKAHLNRWCVLSQRLILRTATRLNGLIEWNQGEQVANIPRKRGGKGRVRRLRIDWSSRVWPLWRFSREVGVAKWNLLVPFRKSSCTDVSQGFLSFPTACSSAPSAYMFEQTANCRNILRE